MAAPPRRAPSIPRRAVEIDRGLALRGRPLQIGEELLDILPGYPDGEHDRRTGIVRIDGDNPGIGEILHRRLEDIAGLLPVHHGRPSPEVSILLFAHVWQYLGLPYDPDR